MTTAPQPKFMPADTLDEFRKMDGPLTYLAAPLGHPEPSVRKARLEEVNRYCGYLTRQRLLVFSPLSHGAALDADDISNSAWYAIGLHFLARCDEMRVLALDGWDDSVGVGLEIRYARQLCIPVSLVDPITYNSELLRQE